MDITSHNLLNPRDITLNYTLPIGSENDVFVVSFGALDDFSVSSLKWAAVYSFAIGSCLTLSFLLWAISLNRTTPIFILNQITMVVMVIRSSLFLSYLMGSLSSLSFTFTGILLPNSYGTYRITVAASAFQTILVACIEASMTYQIFVIFRSPEVKRLGLALTMVTAVGGLTVVGFYINSTVVNARSYADIVNQSVTTTRYGSWVRDIPFILFSVSINLMSSMLACKLFFAIKTRRYLGLKQFDCFHILFIMSCQTMFIPSILVIINYGVSSAKNNILSTVSVVLVVLSLPFSSMWASAANNNPAPSSSTFSFISRSNSNDSDTDTIVGNKFSLFPNKLSRTSSTNSSSEKTVHGLPTTLKSLKIQNPHGFCLSNYSSPPSDIEQIIYGEADIERDGVNKCLSYSSNRQSVDKILDNASDDGILAVTTHNINL